MSIRFSSSQPLLWLRLLVGWGVALGASYETAYVVLHGLPFEGVQDATTDNGEAVDVLLDEATSCTVVRLPAAFGGIIN